MNANEPDAGHPPAESAGPSEAASIPAAAADRPGRPAAILALALGAGILAGSASWAIGEGLLHTFRPPLERTETMGHIIMKARYPDQAAADFKNATLAFTLLGAVLGASLGYAGGLARGSNRSGIRAGLAAMVLGSILAGTGSLALLPAYFREEARSKEDLSRDLTLPLIVHAGTCAAAGLAGGLGLGLGLGLGPAGLIKVGLGGLIGAALGAALYVILGAVLFTGGKITVLLATTWYHRLVDRLLVAALTGYLAATFAVLAPRREPGVPG
jgi:hypothetical protein